jgi:hypothetical protein
MLKAANFGYGKFISCSLTENSGQILDVASGTKEPYSDQYGFHNDMCIFNPAPIT